jgi:ubiquinone biosynthesis O-methyltransferase
MFSELKHAVKKVAFPVLKSLPIDVAVETIWAGSFPRDALIRSRRLRQIGDSFSSKAARDEAYYKRHLPTGLSDSESRKTMDLRAREVLPLMQGKVLDVGCADGYFARLFALNGHNTIGIDQSKHLLGLAQAKQKKDKLPNLEYKYATCEKLPFSDAAFDSIFMGEVLEHVNSPRDVIAEGMRVLKPNGTMVITVPTRLMFAIDHVRTVKPRALRRLLAPFGSIKTMHLVNFDQYLCVAKKN